MQTLLETFKDKNRILRLTTISPLHGYEPIIRTWTGVEYSEYFAALVATKETSTIVELWPHLLRLSLCNEAGELELKSLDEAKEAVAVTPHWFLDQICTAIQEVNHLRQSEEDQKAETKN